MTKFKAFKAKKVLSDQALLAIKGGNGQTPPPPPPPDPEDIVITDIINN